MLLELRSRCMVKPQMKTNHTYDRVQDLTQVSWTFGVKKKVGQNIEYNMFSRLKFSVDFNSEVRNTKF